MHQKRSVLHSLLVFGCCKYMYGGVTVSQNEMTMHIRSVFGSNM